MNTQAIHEWLREDEDLRNEIKNYVRIKIDHGKFLSHKRDLFYQLSIQMFDLPDVHRQFHDYLIAENNKLIEKLYFSLKMTSKNYKNNDNFDKKLFYAKSLNIKDVIESILQIQIKGNFSCPFHGEDKKHSMGIKNNRFKCFTCGEGGDVIDFISRTQGITFIEAVDFLQRF